MARKAKKMARSLNGEPRSQIGRRRLAPEFETLTREIGVYAICDLDNIPIYVGQTVSKKERGIIGRVRRHLTSARSDLIGNRQLDPWELAFVRAWPVQNEDDVTELERLVHQAYGETIVAGRLLPPPLAASPSLPPYHETRILPAHEV